MSNRLPRDYDGRLLIAEGLAGLPRSLWSIDHLNAVGRYLRSGYRDNMSGFERVYGDGSYGRLCFAFAYAAHRLEHEGVIQPDDLEIVESYQALPRFTGSMQDDGVDFATPRARLAAALQAPLNRSGIE